MNKDQVLGRIKEVGGKIQKNVGDVMDDEENQGEGAVKETEGKVQKGYGDVKNDVGNAIDK